MISSPPAAAAAVVVVVVLVGGGVGGNGGRAWGKGEEFVDRRVSGSFLGRLV